MWVMSREGQVITKIDLQATDAWPVAVSPDSATLLVTTYSQHDGTIDLQVFRSRRWSGWASGYVARRTNRVLMGFLSSACD